MTDVVGISTPTQWYPETWSVGGERVFYTPNLLGIEGHYRSGDPAVVKNHVKALDYGWADICIVSCKFSEISLHSIVVIVLIKLINYSFDIILNV
jgi:hypothetical protein